MAQPGVMLTCWLTTTGPASHEALCVHRCCHTHQLHPQRLLTQAWHLRRAQLWGKSCHRTAPGLGFGVGDSLRRRVEPSDSHAVVEGQRRFGDRDGAEPELHAHRHVVCRGGEGARAEKWGGALGPQPRSSDHIAKSAPQMGKGTQDWGNILHGAQNGDFRSLGTCGGTQREVFIQGSLTGLTPHSNHTA